MKLSVIFLGQYCPIFGKEKYLTLHSELLARALHYRLVA